MEFNLNYESRIKGEIKDAIENCLKPLIYTPHYDLKIEGAITKEPVLFKDRESLEYRPFKIGDKWGFLFDCAWFILTGQIDDYDKNRRYIINLDFSGELLLYDDHGMPLKGFTNGSSTFDRNLGEPGKEYYDISDLIKPDGSLKLWVDAGANDLFGFLKDNGTILKASIGFINSDYRRLYYDLEVLHNLLISMDRNHPKYQMLLGEMREIETLIRYQNEGWYDKTYKLAKKLLSNRSESKLDITAIGHAHIDLAWLWPIRETKRKTLRTLANVIYLIERYPRFKFGISQPQQLEWVKETSPQMFEAVKKHVKSGRIVPQGGMWVEADTNVSGEEALVRQMLYGINFFKDEFGVRVNELWLPDVFGYNGNMPQIIKKSGMDYFMTIKISWCLVNKFPYQSYHWEAIDGTKVLAHMPPEGTYNSSVRPEALMKTENLYNEIKKAPVALSVFGIGDGGGGPGEEHVERIFRQKDLMGVPKIQFGDQNEFFEKLVKYEEKLPTWKGELYLENHRGCYTSAPEVKRYNRLLEEQLRSSEVYLTLQGYHAKYKEQLTKYWKEVLLYQFHDILPGSSIKRVYDECEPRYQLMHEQLKELVEAKQGKIFNPNLRTANLIKKDQNRYLEYELEPLSTKGKLKAYSFIKEGKKTVFETENLVIKFSAKTGAITSLLHKKTDRELLKDGGNKLAFYQDYGNGWDIKELYRKQIPITPKLTSRVVNEYSRFYEIEQTYQVENTTIKETILIDTKTDLVYFSHQTDLKDLERMLRVSFDFDTKATEAKFDIQFGELTRSALNNTKVEQAQYEVPGQKWVCYEDKDLVLGLINKSKYGFYVKNGILDIHLTRSTNYPAVNLGIQKTSYSYVLYVSSNKNTANLDLVANNYNTYFPEVEMDVDFSDQIKIDNDLIALSAIKGAENKEGIVIRLYNRSDSNQKTTLNVKYLLFETNMVEENPVLLESNHLTFKPYEVRTFLLKKK